jgi:hypothetical protein
MFRLSTNKCYDEQFKSIEQILHVLFKYKPKRNVRLFQHSKMTYFHWGAKILLKKIDNVFFLAPMSFIFLSNENL